MSNLIQTDKIFFENTGMDPESVTKIVTTGLDGSDGGELYLEKTVQESIRWIDGRVDDNTKAHSEGFGLRYVANEAAGYAVSNEFSESSVKEAMSKVQRIQKLSPAGGIITLNNAPAPNPHAIYTADNPLLAYPFEDKVRLLSDIDSYARTLDPNVVDVSISLSAAYRVIQIIRADGERLQDLRPMMHFGVNVNMRDGSRGEMGGFSTGGRYGYKDIFNEATWKDVVHKAVESAKFKLNAGPAPAGEMPVVMGPGWNAVWLHEAVGHGLEGDFNRMGSSAFSGLIGKQVASKGVTVVDQGNIQDLRGSLMIDDEGTPTQKNILIEDGILRAYMQDLTNARLMGLSPTGNGRRQSFKHLPIPRMTNTFMDAGNHDPEDIISSVKKGLYVQTMSGGQVDIVSGKYVFAVSEAYLIENGKKTAPVKGATLIGNGPDTMKMVDMVGNDPALDPGIGTCGKDGQSVPVGIGQPTIKLRKVTVGGTQGPG